MKRTTLVYLFMAFALAFSSCTSEVTTSPSEEESRFDIQRPVFQDQDFLITDYGAVKDGSTLNTDAINKAIIACSKAGGGKVVIPSGVWITGPISLKSNVNLHVAEGALVMFTKDFDEYPYVYSYFEGKRDYRAMPLIYGDSLENIAITGKGIFDGSGQAWRPVKKGKMTSSQWSSLVNSGGVLNDREDMWWPNEYAYEASKNPNRIKELYGGSPEMEKYKAYFRPSLVQLISCDKVLLEGPLFENSPGWCIHPLMCTHLTVNDISVKNPWFAQNGDGIDVESCKYVSIKNSTFDVGDDAICLKSGKDKEGRDRGMPTQYVEVDNCIVHHGHGGFVVGSEMSGGVKDVYVENCSFTGTDVGLRFKSTRGRGGVVENIHISNIRMIDIARNAIIFNLFYAGLAPTEMGESSIDDLFANAPEVSEETPAFRNIFISDVNCQGAALPLNVMGLPEMPVSNISIENSVFRSERGISCLFASDLKISDVIVHTDNTQTPSMVLYNVNGAVIEDFAGNGELLLALDGKKTANIKLNNEDPELARSLTHLGNSVREDEVSYE